MIVMNNEAKQIKCAVSIWQTLGRQEENGRRRLQPNWDVQLLTPHGNFEAHINSVVHWPVTVGKQLDCMLTNCQTERMCLKCVKQMEVKSLLLIIIYQRYKHSEHRLKVDGKNSI